MASWISLENVCSRPLFMYRLVCFLFFCWMVGGLPIWILIPSQIYDFQMFWFVDVPKAVKTRTWGKWGGEAGVLREMVHAGDQTYGVPLRNSYTLPFIVRIKRPWPFPFSERDLWYKVSATVSCPQESCLKVSPSPGGTVLRSCYLWILKKQNTVFVSSTSCYQQVELPYHFWAVLKKSENQWLMRGVFPLAFMLVELPLLFLWDPHLQIQPTIDWKYWETIASVLMYRLWKSWSCPNNTFQQLLL